MKAERGKPSLRMVERKLMVESRKKLKEVKKEVRIDQIRIIYFNIFCRQIKCQLILFFTFIMYREIIHDRRVFSVNSEQSKKVSP